MDRDLFLERVGASLRRAAATRAFEPSSAVVPMLPAPDDREGMVRLFAERLRELRGVATRVPSREAGMVAVAGLLRDLGASACDPSFTPADSKDRLQGSGVARIVCPPALRWPAIEEHWTGDPRAAAFGLSEADWGIAASGTVVLRHRGHHGRACSLVPPAVGFMLPVSRLLPRLGSVVAVVQDDACGPPTCVTFVSGVSHSGDIADMVCYGVHGPAIVHVWLIDNE